MTVLPDSDTKYVLAWSNSPQRVLYRQYHHIEERMIDFVMTMGWPRTQIPKAQMPRARMPRCPDAQMMLLVNPHWFFLTDHLSLQIQPYESASGHLSYVLYVAGNSNNKQQTQAVLLDCLYLHRTTYIIDIAYDQYEAKLVRVSSIESSMVKLSQMELPRGRCKADPSGILPTSLLRRSHIRSNYSLRGKMCYEVRGQYTVEGILIRIIYYLASPNYVSSDQ